MRYSAQYLAAARAFKQSQLAKRALPKPAAFLHASGEIIYYNPRTGPPPRRKASYAR